MKRNSIGWPARTLFLAALVFAPAATPAVAQDAVLLWNTQTNLAIQTTSMDPFNATRALAMESVAVLDTLRSLNGEAGFLVRLPAPRDGMPEVAASAAAHAVLVYLFPDRKAELDATLAKALARFPATESRARSINLGEAVAAAVIAIRDRDGWNRPGAVKIGNEPGQWRPTPPRFDPPLHPQWLMIAPFAITRPDQFRPPGPPALGTPAFNAAMEETRLLGDRDSHSRTADQTEAAHYWSDAIGTYAPAGHWNVIAGGALRTAGRGLSQEAALFAELNVAIADAAIAMTDAKYTYWLWRPITAIRSGSATVPGHPDWTPMLDTPNHPSYVSGHSAFSGAAAVVLTAAFGARPFRAGSASTPGVQRAFRDFDQAADEAANSRLWGGIHYRFDNDDGLAMGRAVGAWAHAAFQHPGFDRPPVIVLDSTGSAGFAVASAAPVRSVEVALDGGPSTAVPLNPDGRFVLPRCPKGEHTVSVTASGPGGKIATVTTTMNGGS
jgi:PAP2 superfamily